MNINSYYYSVILGKYFLFVKDVIGTILRSTKAYRITTL